MKAIVYDKYGAAENLEIREVSNPEPKDNEVLVKVHAVSINDWDWQLLQGSLFINRMQNGLFKPKRKILGSDIAGRIEATGKNVSKFKPGDEVYGDLSGRWGGFAEYVCASENALARKPATMTFEQAAAIPQAGMLALQGLRDNGQIQSGQKILINGAGGGVGTFGIQLLKEYDVEVTGVDSAEKLEIMRTLGFDHVIDYTKEDFTKSGHQYDLILDTKTNRPMSSYTRTLKPNGLYATVGGDTMRILQAFLLGRWINMTQKKRIVVVILKVNKDLDYINELFEVGKIKPVIDRTFTLDELPEAMRYYGEGKQMGKVLISLK